MDTTTWIAVVCTTALVAGGVAVVTFALIAAARDTELDVHTQRVPRPWIEANDARAAAARAMMALEVGRPIAVPDLTTMIGRLLAWPEDDPVKHIGYVPGLRARVRDGGLDREAASHHARASRMFTEPAGTP
jgi:hypothetical protein